MNIHRIDFSAPDILVICVNECREEEIQGNIWHCYEKGAIPFQSIIQMVQIMERLFDSIHYPESALRSRFFVEEKHETIQEAIRVLDKDRVINQRGEKGTFVVHVQYRQNATWQGEVLWAEKKISRKFRSALELMKLIDGALDECQETERGDDDHEN